MKIVYEGFYGFKNAGDDAFVEVSSWGAEKYWNCHNNVFLGASLPQTVKKINTSQLLPQIKGADRINLLWHLKNSQYMISAGGSTFSEVPSHSNKAVAQQLLKIKPRLKLGAIGVSIGPFKNLQKEKEVEDYLKSLKFLAVRDQKSFDIANSFNLPYQPINAFDLAALLPQVYKENSAKKTENSKKTIGLSICNYERYTGGDLGKEKKRNDYFKTLVGLLQEKTDVNFKVFIFNDNKQMGDREVSHFLAEDIPKERVNFVPYLANVKKTWDEVAVCDMMISTRLHASIFACYAKVPFFLIEYHRKCSNFLEDVGQDESYRLYDAEKPPQQAFDVIRDVLTNKSFKTPVHLEKTIKMAERNFSETLMR